MKEIQWVNTGTAIPLDRFQPHPGNPKVHTKEQLAHIRNSILTFGFLDPIGIWGEHAQVVEGHGRLEALRSLVRSGDIRIPEAGVPVIRLDHLTPVERDAYMLEHNQATMETPWDNGALNSILSGISETLDMQELFGFDPENEADEKGLFPPEPDIMDHQVSYQLIVMCTDEEDMQEKHDQLARRGAVQTPQKAAR